MQEIWTRTFLYEARSFIYFLKVITAVYFLYCSS